MALQIHHKPFSIKPMHGLLVALIGTGVLVLGLNSGDKQAPAASEKSNGWAFVPDQQPPTEDAGIRQAQPSQDARTATELRRILYEGSLAGTRPVGDWCIKSAALYPCPGLRDRFEYYINGLGEISITEVRHLIEVEANLENGADLAKQIMAIYDKYWLVRNHSYRHRVDMADTSTWMPALTEAQQLRQQVLGPDWASAFYKEEEHDFLQTYQRALNGQPPPPSQSDPVPSLLPGKDPQAVREERILRYGKTVTDALEALDEQQQSFDLNLQRAKNEWQQLQSQFHLSDVARKDQINQFIAANFDAKDHKRVRGLIMSVQP